MFLTSSKSTRENLGELKKAVETLTQTSTHVSIKQLDWYISNDWLCYLLSSVIESDQLSSVPLLTK